MNLKKLKLKIKNNIMANTQLKKLRDETGLSYSMCLKALDESKNNIDEAKKLLSKWGIDFADKKASRTVKTGSIFSYIHHNQKIGAIVELFCETDFVAKTDDFQSLGKNIAMQIASNDPKDNTQLMKSEFIKDESKSIEILIKDTIFKLGEKITIGRFQRFAL